MPKTLVIAEKPSVATDLAKALGVKKDGDWYENDKWVISSAVGHLLELAPPEGFEPARGKWKIENLPSLPPDQLSHVALGHAHFDQRASLLLHFAHVDRVNIVNQCLNNHLDGFSHSRAPLLTAYRSLLTVCLSLALIS